MLVSVTEQATLLVLMSFAQQCPRCCQPQLVVESGSEVIPREDKVQGFWPLPRSMMAFHLKDREITLASTLSALILFSPRFAVDSL